MAKLSLSSVGPLLKEKRGSRGIRDVATEIGISSATLSRVENGKLPDLDTFSKMCRWLQVDPGEILGCKDVTESASRGRGTVAVHFRADRTLDMETVQSLTEMILRAREMMADR